MICTAHPIFFRAIKSKRMRWAVHVARIGESRDSYRVLLEKPEGKISLGRPRHRWEGNIKTNVQDVGVWNGLSWLRIGTGGGHL